MEVGRTKSIFKQYSTILVHRISQRLQIRQDSINILILHLLDGPQMIDLPINMPGFHPENLVIFNQ